MKSTPSRILLSLLFAHTLAACGGGDGAEQRSVSEPASTSPPAQSSLEIVHGHFLGEAAIDGETLFVEALITVDGAVRIHIGSFQWAPESVRTGGGPPVDLLNPEESMQFVGNIETDGAEASGFGVILGQMCHVPVPGRFCDQPAVAEIRVAPGDPTPAGLDLGGELKVTIQAGEEVWALDLTAWSAYYRSRAGSVDGVYRELLAPFAQKDDVLINVDTGRMTFESAASGCKGEGILTPHLDGEFDVHDVSLFIESCSADYSLLNGEFDGLATETQSSYWNYDLLLVIFLAAPDGPAPRPALAMRAYAQYGQPRAGI